jgi:hypothetical protein
MYQQDAKIRNERGSFQTQLLHDGIPPAVISLLEPKSVENFQTTIFHRILHPASTGKGTLTRDLLPPVFFYTGPPTRSPLYINELFEFSFEFAEDL